MIFGRPGSGKTIFATWLSNSLNLPLHHLDKYFYIQNWIERDYKEFLQIQENIVNTELWIIDGNSTDSLEMRFAKPDLVLYFNFPKITCVYRIIKRFFNPNKSFADRAPGCFDRINISFLKHIWGFEKKFSSDIESLKKSYQNVVFKEINSDNDLNKLKNELFSKL